MESDKLPDKKVNIKTEEQPAALPSQALGKGIENKHQFEEAETRLLEEHNRNKSQGMYY